MQAQRHIGADLHRNKFTCCVRLENGRNYLTDWKLEDLPRFVKKLRPSDEIAVEMTGNTRLFRDAVAPYVARVVVVDPNPPRGCCSAPAGRIFLGSPTSAAPVTVVPPTLGCVSAVSAIEILERDGHQCPSCGSAERLHMHHRKPGVNDRAWLITVCAGCHARLHRLAALRIWIPELLVVLWIEHHPGTRVQFQLPVAA